MQPIATPATKGRGSVAGGCTSLDGTCLDVADTEENRAEYGLPWGQSGGERLPRRCGSWC
jgi:hypothetical protein